MLNEAIEKCFEPGETCIKSSKDIFYRANYYVQHRPLLSSGVATLFGSTLGAIIFRRSH
jgi:ElaB/YqjD/DUF883 family membrane-anchored ribosome-binding protein